MTYLMGRYEVSQRRACRGVQATRSLVYYESRNGRIQGYKLSIFARPIPTLTYNFKF